MTVTPAHLLVSGHRLKHAIARQTLVVLVLAVFLAHATFFTVAEGQAIVVTRLGRPIRELSAPGAYWKLPSPIDKLQVIDVRRQVLTTPQVATLTRDKKNIVLKTFVVWHVAEPLRFLQAVGLPETARVNLTSMVAAAKNQQLGQADLSDLVSLNREQIKLEQIESRMRTSLHEAALPKLGIAIDEIGFERITLPQENMTAVLDRMRAERNAEANRIRTEGAKQARAIRDEAHVASQEILRHGREQAGEVFAEAERQAGEILAAAHQRSPAFFEFWNALQAAKQSLKERSTLVLRSDQLFFEALTRPPAAEPPHLPRNHQDATAAQASPHPSSSTP